MIDTYYSGMGFIKFFLLMVAISVIFGAFFDMSKRTKKWYVFICFSIFFAVMGFRNYYMGNDTLNYIRMYGNIAALDSPLKYIKDSNMEPGYILFNWLISRKAEYDPRLLFVVYSVIICLSLGRFVYKYVDYPGIFVCMFVGLTQMDFFLSGMRQAIAIAFFTFAFDALIKRKRLRYFILVALASSFHYSAIILFFIYPFIASNTIENKKSQSGTIVFLLFVATIFFSLFLEQIYEKVISFFPRYASYENSDYMKGDLRLASILKTTVFLVFYIVPKLLSSRTGRQALHNNRSERLAMLNIAVTIMAIPNTVFMRFGTYFMMFANMYYCNSFNKFKEKERQIMVVATIICVFAYGLVITVFKTPDWQMTYPIKLDFRS